jgi:hypothetical protein
MALPSAQEVAQKWAQRAGAAAQDYVAGAQRTDKDPTALAIAAQPRMRARILEAIDSGKVTAGLRRAGRQGWLDGITSKGASNYSSGVSAAQGKVEQAFTSLLSYEANLQSRLASMPANTDAERDARALFWIQGMRQYVKPGS